MTSKSEKDRIKQIQDKCQGLLSDMLRDEDNKYCVDCDAKGPRWASWNLGIFLCIRCAGIHRNLGVHISKVKSVNLDTWTPEQVVSLQQMGNSRARAVYEANIPDNFRRPQTDSALEAFVRAKYEHKKYIAKEWVPQPVPKINWDKELSEEAERQKKRKKDAKIQQIRKPVGVVPQLLPKPQSSSPKPSLRSSPVSSVDANKSPKLVSQDLLGLDTPTTAKSIGLTSSLKNGEDVFSSFLSAPLTLPPPETNTNEEKGVETIKGRSAEEDSFFNQPAPSNQEQRRLTKDSILALYSTAPLQNPKTNPNPMFGISGGVYTQPAQAGFPPQSLAGMPFGINNGMVQMQNASFSHLSQSGTQMRSQIQNGPFSQASQSASKAPSGTSNPFFSSGVNPTHNFSQMTQLPQQMSQMHIGAQPQEMMALPQNMPQGVQSSGNNATICKFPTPTNSGHTLATNLWQ